MWGQRGGQIIFNDGKLERLQITDNHVQNNFKTEVQKQEDDAEAGFNAENGNLHTKERLSGRLWRDDKRGSYL